ncbi:winged helix-turn-helix domain-containing protein [Marinobacter sp. S6332]|uniref:winged helix-turn-helix domain-containing protein n=1 Tax=Marinobacter sp. S6332 TaxID=2926403 RepID=UPI0032B0F496
MRQKFNVRLSDVSVGRLLRNLGLTPQKPLHRAYQKKPRGGVREGSFTKCSYICRYILPESKKASF